MYKILRIIFCVLAVIFAAAAIFVFILTDWVWGLLTVLGAVICAALMMLFKKMQEREELKANPPPPQGDFITGKISNKENTEEKSE